MALEHLAGSNANHTMDEEGVWRVPSPNRLGLVEIWPESGVGRPAAILGVNKHSEG